MRRRASLPTLVGLLGLLTALASAQDKPAKPTGDPELDFLMGKAPTTRPAASPSTLPTGDANSPLAGAEEGDGRRKAVITLSNDEKIRCRARTTIDKPIRLWDSKAKQYRDIPFELIKTMEAKILWEREEKEWHFRESGSDIKEYTGKTYPAREMEYTITLVNGQSMTGGVVAPLYLLTLKNDEKTLVLNKRSKGEIGQTLKDLVYVKHVQLEEDGK